MGRLTHVIPSVLIKDRTIVGASNKIERMPLTQLAGKLVPTVKPSSSTQARPHSVIVCILDGSKDVQGARHEPKGRPVLNILATGCP